MKPVVMGVIMAVLAPQVPAEVYHYIDGNGRKVFVDRLSEVPSSFRDQMDVLEEAKPVKAPSAPVSQVQSLPDADAVAPESVLEEIDRLEGEMKRLEQPVIIEGNRVKVPVSIKYLTRTIQAELILDTGASHTVLYQNVIRSLAASPKPAGFATVVGGAKLAAGSIKLNTMKFGPITRSDAEVLVVEPESVQPYDGLLGMDVLATLKYEIDFEKEVVIWGAEHYRRLARVRDELRARAGG